MGLDQPEDVDGNWLAGELRMASEAFVGQLRSIAATERAGATPVPNLEWDVADLAAHLISLPSLYRAENALDGPYVPPDDWAEFSKAARAHITSRDLGELADQLAAEVEEFLGELDLAEPKPRRLYGQATTTQNLAAGVLSELIMHGGDLGAITGAAVRMSRPQALVILPASMALVPAFVDPAGIRRCVGTYHLRFRGGLDYTFRATPDGKLAVSGGKPEKADCHLVADPVTYLMLSLGRMGQVRAALTGKVLAYGRKPWLLARLNSAKVPGV